MAIADQIIPFTDFTEEEFTEFTNGKLPDVILECTKGTSLPLTLIVSGDFFQSEGTSSSGLQVIKTCYVKCSKDEEFLFSADLETWKTFFDFFTGEIRGIAKIEDNHPAAGLSIQLSQK